ncbi:uncharacterized protein LOC132285099 [Cornus florida]|uniref:uncharacterized protein LOC132285099 n=1 Tax=Cornus florida TaxID=4283 RepID=UPI0028A260AF|nr:uncharacterized protein LOC132285099 [Cornus florida]
MKSDTPLDYAVFQLSPKRSRCELFVSSDGNTEKLASGLVNSFVTHLKVAEEQVALAVKSIKLEVERCKNAETWFTKGTLERFLLFVSMPEVLELVNTFDAEMSQLEAARRIYSQEVGDKFPGTLGGDGVGATAAADSTKKELLRAIDVRLVAVRQDLITACSRAASVGFTPGTVSELQLFADQFGASHLNEACRKFILLCERHPDLINSWKDGAEDRTFRSSYWSEMSINECHTEEQLSGFHHSQLHHENKHPTIRELDTIQKQQQHHLKQLKPFICHQPKASTVPILIQHSRESSIDKDDGSGNDLAAEKLKKEESIETESSQTSQPARQLSVQDRISLFENKQKENSGSGGKPLVGRSVELRRLSSEVSSTPAVIEKAVLRRWSGASDMSIDLHGEKKGIESPLRTPSSSSVSQTKSDDRKGLNETATSSKPKLKNVTDRVDDSCSKDPTDSRARAGVTCGREEIGTNAVDLTVYSVSSDDALESDKLASTLGRVKNDVSKDQTLGKIQLRSSLARAEDNILKDQATSETLFKSLPGERTELFGLMDQGKYGGSMGDGEEQGRKGRLASKTQIAGSEDLAVPLTQFGSFASRQSDVKSPTVSYDAPHSEFMDKVEDVGLRDHSVSVSRFRSPLRTAMDYGQLGGVSDLKTQEASASQFKGTEDDSLASLRQRRSLAEVKEVSKKDFPSSEKQLHDSRPQRMKFKKQVSSSEQIKKSQGRRDERCSDYENSKTLYSVKMVSEGQGGFGSIPTASLQQVRKVRHLKGKQELNDELKMKANELEDLFAEHKLMIPVDLSSSTQRTSPSEMQVEQAACLPYRIPAVEIAPEELPGKNIVADPAGSSRNGAKFNASSLMKMLDNRDYGDALKQKFSELGFLDDSRGKFYGQYMQKRDAKLMEEWDFNRSEKEVRMKAMQDSLELSRAEMKAKLSGTADRQDSLFCIRRRAERLRSFNTRSFMQREQQLLDFVNCEEKDLSAEQKPFVHDMSFDETSFGDDACRSIQSKKLLPNRNWSSSTPRTSAAPVARSAVKASNCSSGRQRMRSENPLAQSVPNFSDLRKENTKPSSGVSKSTARPNFGRYSCSKNTCEDVALVKEEKQQWLQSLRKGFASPAEFKDASPMNSESIALTPLKFDKEQFEQNLYHKFTDSVESKPFLGNNTGIGHGDGAGIAKLRASLASKPINHEEVSDVLAFEPEDFVDVVKDEDELETMTTDNNIMDNRIPRSSQESSKLFNSEFENGGVLRFFSQVDRSLVAGLPAAVPSPFHSFWSKQDSPGESPMSWNAHIPYSFSYLHETSDIGAFADSPIGSPVSGNSLS